MRSRLVIGNWKSNGSLTSNHTLLERIKHGASQLEGVTSAVCVPYPYLAQTQQMLEGSVVLWGAQDVSQHTIGAYTGAVAAPMLGDFGCRYVIVGHSERRTLFGENDALVAAKFRAALNARLTPVLCVGENLQEREAGITENVVERQLNAVIEQEGAQALTGAIVAYEPVWAIGTGRNASPEQAQAVHAFIRVVVAAHGGTSADLTILYGGSVKGGNAAQLFAMPDIDGGLIGGASLAADEFLSICRSALQ